MKVYCEYVRHLLQWESYSQHDSEHAHYPHLTRSIPLYLEQRVLGSGAIWEHIRNVRPSSGSGQFLSPQIFYCLPITRTAQSVYNNTLLTCTLRDCIYRLAAPWTDKRALPNDVDIAGRCRYVQVLGIQLCPNPDGP